MKIQVQPVETWVELPEAEDEGKSQVNVSLKRESEKEKIPSEEE